MSHQNSSPLTSDLESTANSDSAPLSTTPTPTSHLDIAEESVETSEDTDTVSGTTRSSSRHRAGGFKKRVSAKNLSHAKVGAGSFMVKYARTFYNNYEETVANIESQKDPQPELVIFPDDIEIVKEERITREEINPLPTSLHHADQLPASVRESAALSKQQHYQVLHFKEAEYGFGVDRCQPVWDRTKTPRRTDEVTRGDSAGQLDASLLGPYSAEDVSRDEKQRWMQMSDLFSEYDTSNKKLGVQEITDFNRVLIKRPFSSAGLNKTELLVEIGELQGAGLKDEPVFCTLSIHDISKRRRLSEDYHFEVTPLTLRGLFSREDNCPANDLSLFARRCLFSISGEVNEHIYLVLRINRVLQDEEKIKSGGFLGMFAKKKKSGSVTPSDEKKRKEKKDKHGSKGANSDDSGSQGGSQTMSGSIFDTFRTPWCWGAVQLFTGAGSSLGPGVIGQLAHSDPVPLPSVSLTHSPALVSVHGTLPSAITNLAPVKTAPDDATLYEVLSNDKELKKIKTMPGTLTLKVTRHTDPDTRPPGCHSPCGVPLRTQLGSAAAAPSLNLAPGPRYRLSVDETKALSEPHLTTPQNTAVPRGNSSGRLNPPNVTPNLTVQAPTPPPPPPPTTAGMLTREVQDLTPQNKDVLLSYTHQLFVYPQHITGAKSLSKVGQIQLAVKLRDRDTNYDVESGDTAVTLPPSTLPPPPPPISINTNAPPTVSVPVPAAPTLTSYSQHVTQGLTTIQVVDKRPEFHDEIKLCLPPVLTTPKLHLLFILYAIDPKKYKRTIVGYAILPLTHEGRVVLEEEQSLMLAAELPNNYLEPEQQQHIKWLEAQKRVFNVRVKLVSSLYSQDVQISNLLHEYSQAQHDSSTLNPSLYLSLIPAVKAVQLADGFELLRHFPLVLNILIKLMCGNDPRTGKEAFLALLHVIKTVNNVSNMGKYSPLLRSYMNYVFDNPAPSSSVTHMPYESIVKHYVALLPEKNATVTNFDMHWFLFGLIVKSMALKLTSTAPLERDRRKRFSDEYVHGVNALMNHLLCERDPGGVDYISSMALFLKDLFAFLDRGIVFSIIWRYLEHVKRQHATSPLFQTFKFLFLKILSQYEHYIPLNLPPTQFTAVTDSELAQLGRAIRDRHVLAGMILDEVGHYFQLAIHDPKSDSLLRTQLMIVLRALLVKHESDMRYRNRVCQERIAALYFPYLLMLLEDHNGMLSSLPEIELEEWLVCCMYVLKNTPRTAVHSWLNLEPHKRRLNLFSLIDLSVKTFVKGGLSKQIDLVALDLIAHYLQHWGSGEDKDEASALLKRITFTLQRIFHKGEEQLDTTSNMLSVLFATLRLLLHTCPRPIFADVQSEFVETLIYELMRQCNHFDPTIRARAAALLYLAISKNYQLTNDLTRTHNAATVAISKIVGKGNKKHKELDMLQNSLTNIKNLFHERDAANTKLTQGVDDMMTRVFNLISYNTQIEHSSHDQEMTQDLYYMISTGFTATPDLRLAWLDNLAQYHRTQENWEEAAQCKMQIASLVAQYLASQRHFLPKMAADWCYFPFISPFIGDEQRLFEHEEQTSQAANQLVQSDNWNIKKLIHTLREAIELFDTATKYECCIEVYTLLGLIYKAQRKIKYLEVIQNLDRYKSLCVRLNNDKDPPERAYPVYYRVGFYGTGWAEMNGREFIYKKSTKFNLPNFKKYLLDQYNKQFGDKVEVLTTNEDIYITNANTGARDYNPNLKLDPSRVYIQVGSVSPHFTHEEAEERVTRTEQNFNINKFLFETGFTDAGKSQTDDLSLQKKKKTIFTTRAIFPYLKNRVEVISKETVILSPIENAIELIVRQTGKLTEELHNYPTRIVTLQQVIQGSVVPMVNAGPLKILDIFLCPGAIKNNMYERRHVLRLMNAMESFVRQAGFAIKFNNSLIVDNQQQKKFQEMVEKCYADLNKQVRDRCDLLRAEQQS